MNSAKNVRAPYLVAWGPSQPRAVGDHIMTGEPEIYYMGYWRDLPKRARGPKKHPAAKVKREMAAYIQRHPELSNGAKLVGALLVSWYSESKQCAWPSNKTMAEELAISVRRVQEHTAKLHEQGLIYKVIGGGWDKGTVRHTSNRYYPAFSKVVNQDTGHIIRNAPYLCTESPETCRNPGDPMTGTASVRKSHPANRENRQKSVTPHDGIRVSYKDKEYAASGVASPAPLCSAGLAPPPPTPEDRLELTPMITLAELAAATDLGLDDLIWFTWAVMLIEDDLSPEEEWRYDQIEASILAYFANHRTVGVPRRYGCEHPVVELSVGKHDGEWMIDRYYDIKPEDDPFTPESTVQIHRYLFGTDSPNFRPDLDA